LITQKGDNLWQLSTKPLDYDKCHNIMEWRDCANWCGVRNNEIKHTWTCHTTIHICGNERQVWKPPTQLQLKVVMQSQQLQNSKIQIYNSHRKEIGPHKNSCSNKNDSGGI
jgi:hypothetical protein